MKPVLHRPSKRRTEATVHSAFLRFRGLLHELGLSGHAEEVISVKVELDTNPPGGAHTETDLVRRFVIINMLHYGCRTVSRATAGDRPH